VEQYQHLEEPAAYIFRVDSLPPLPSPQSEDDGSRFLQNISNYLQDDDRLHGITSRKTVTQNLIVVTAEQSSPIYFNSLHIKLMQRVHRMHEKSIWQYSSLLTLSVPS
jgi:hypothetical protein